MPTSAGAAVCLAFTFFSPDQEPYSSLFQAALCSVSAPSVAQVNHQRVRCSHKCSGWSQQDGAEYITCHFKGQPDIK